MTIQSVGALLEKCIYCYLLQNVRVVGGEKKKQRRVGTRLLPVLNERRGSERDTSKGRGKRYVRMFELTRRSITGGNYDELTTCNYRWGDETTHEPN